MLLLKDAKNTLIFIGNVKKVVVDFGKIVRNSDTPIVIRKNSDKITEKKIAIARNIEKYREVPKNTDSIRDLILPFFITLPYFLSKSTFINPTSF